MSDPMSWNGQHSNIPALRKEIAGIEGDIDNLIKDGFEDTHPRIQALRAENKRKQQQIKELSAEDALRTSLPQVLKEQQNLLDAYTDRFNQAVANQIRIISRAIPPPE